MDTIVLTICQVTAAKQLIGNSLPRSVASAAENELKKFHIKIITQTKITDSKLTGDGKTELTLSNGEKLMTDLYLPTVGVLPNTEYIPKDLLNEKGDVKVDAYLRVKSVPDVWAAGDVVDCQPSQFVYCRLSSVYPP
jgi:pyruvate/2-oxoglutarate dehydrogenase complex dihydrolipoamide dehydrogenase (E3) component